MQARSWCSLVAQQMEISKFCFKTTFLWNEIFFMLYSRLFFSVGDWCWPVLGPHDRGRIHSFWGEGRLWKPGAAVHEPSTQTERTQSRRENSRACWKAKNTHENEITLLCLGKSIMSVMSIWINYLMKLFSFVDSRFNTTLYHCHNINNYYGKTLILHKNVSRKK